MSTSKQNPSAPSQALRYPPATIGIMGGGQLARMISLAASFLGYRTHIYCPEPDSPACHVTSNHTIASYTDEKALNEFCQKVDCITFEFENIPSQSLDILSKYHHVYPHPHIISLCQNRLKEKDFLNNIGLKTAPYACVRTFEDLERAVKEIPWPCILKTAQWGYDGKGQQIITNKDHMEEIKKNWKDDLYILEKFIEFQKEISILIARSENGKMACFPPCENQHKNHILYTTVAPAPDLQEKHVNELKNIAQNIAKEMNYVGLLAIELFMTHEGSFYINEMAPRPHNSGHWTIDACPTNQFEQMVRAICGLELGETWPHHQAKMINILGADMPKVIDYFNDPQAHVHLYGKTKIQPQRKMGHVNFLFPFTS